MAVPHQANRILLILLCAVGTVAQAEDGAPPAPTPNGDPVSTLHALRYHYANDLFAARDYYFTQGMGLTWTAPCLSESPLAIPLPKLDEGALRQVSLLWRYAGFTPIDYEERGVQLGDHPFVAYMYLAHRSESLRADGGASLSAQWSLGYMGPGVGGKEFQAEVHRVTGNDSPQGWRNQIKDDLIAQVELAYTHRLLRHESLFDLKLELELRGGTLHSDASAGLRLRLGLLGAPLGPPGPDLRVYLWAAAQGRAVGFNATLEGGVFNSDSVYTLSANDVKRLVGAAQVGVTLESGFFGLEFSLTVLSPEFSHGRSHGWGQVGLTVFLG